MLQRTVLGSTTTKSPSRGNRSINFELFLIRSSIVFAVISLGGLAIFGFFEGN
jgi:hypothetical protein